MSSVKRWAIAALLVGGVGGCVAEPYTPDPSALTQRMSIEEAVATLKAVDGYLCPSSYCNGFSDLVADHEVASIDVTDDGTVVFVRDDGDRSRTFPLQTSKISCTHGDINKIDLNEGYFLSYHENIERVCDALLVLKQTPSLKQQQAAFEAAAQSYRAAAVKPVPGEDVRRYKVQAEAAVREKRFADAAAAYAKALEIAPWWPEGRFNRALVLAEIGQYRSALTEMQDYLALVPDAPNARMAQDKVYEWEAKVPAGSAGSGGRGSSQ